MNSALLSLRSIERAVAILAAMSVTAASGLAAVEAAIPATGSRARSAGVAVPAAPPAAAEPRDSGLDPWLQQINHGGAHHG